MLNPKSYKTIFNLLKFEDYLRLLFTKNKFSSVQLKNGIHLKFRNKTIDDLLVAEYVFIDKFHIPPFEIAKNPIILDLGSNIGCTILDYNRTYPNAKIVGYEMDKGNFALCQENISNIKTAKVYNKAIWFKSRKVAYEASTNNDSFTAKDISESDKNRNNQIIETITIQEILHQHQIETVDFMKIDIEGAEIEIFEKGSIEWLKKVNALHIEIHDKSKIKNFIDILKSYNFEVVKDSKHWSALFARKGLNK